MTVSELRYQPHEGHGVTASVVAACISFVAVVTLLCLLAWVAITGRGPTDKPFLRTHIGVYFLSLMTADLAQTIGGIMNIRWVAAHHVSIGRFCTAQAAIKQFADVGAAMWSAVIAIHTFRLLFFNSHTSHMLCFTTLVVVWGVIIAIVAIGPTVIESPEKGDYFGIAGYWCWITSGYSIERFALEYLFMFASAFISLFVYTMVFFRLRGNLVAEGYRIRILSVASSRAWNLEAGRAVMESNTMSVAWQLMWYPVSYTVSILPIAAARWTEFSGSQVPFPVKMFASVVFMLSGLVNTILFVTTRRVLPPIKLRRKSISSSGPQGISISVHATRTQHISSATGEPSYVISLPPPKFTHIGAQAYELEDCSQLPQVPEKSEGRLSGESTGISFTGTGKDGYDTEDNSIRGPRAV
ncbi:G protein coupled glucose receptor regulating Gpa2 protein [Ceratobasidium sp. AG-Ba]|nr:G protein coupled glucose receptor regulating Gpa2 protein [Ceratobasidium sp. AG-Ba]QRW08230.1 G protein coupled glucose receptor regulating Gpa2 protein [Ceratobasidium sp. AG-Ba]